MITCPVSVLFHRGQNRTTRSQPYREKIQRRVALLASVEDNPLLLGFEGHAEGMRARRAGRKRKGEGEECIIKEERKEEEGAVDVDVDSFEAVAGCIDDETPSLIREADRHSFKIVGVTHFQTALRRAVAGGLSSVCTVIMEREPDNKYDKLAVAIKTLDGRQLGHIARQDNVGEGGKSVFWCPRLLGTANVESFVKNETRFYYGTVTGHAMAGSMAPGCLAALPFEVPMDLIGRCRTLAQKLDDAASRGDDASLAKGWVRIKARLLGQSRAASMRARAERPELVDDTDDGDVPRCMMSGLPCETIEPVWRFEKGARRVVLENWVVCHRAMRRVLYVDEGEAVGDAVDRLVRLNRGMLRRDDAEALYTRTLQTCQTRGNEGWSLEVAPGSGNEFCLSYMHEG